MICNYYSNIILIYVFSDSGYSAIFNNWFLISVTYLVENYVPFLI
jgi:hypothetical protein